MSLIAELNDIDENFDYDVNIENSIPNDEDIDIDDDIVDESRYVEKNNNDTVVIDENFAKAFPCTTEAPTKKLVTHVSKDYVYRPSKIQNGIPTNYFHYFIIIY